MILEKLRERKWIKGHSVVHMDDLKKDFPELFPPELEGAMDYKTFEEKVRPVHQIFIRHDKQSISFDFSPNGCSAGVLAETARQILKDSPLRKHKRAVSHLRAALDYLDA